MANLKAVKTDNNDEAGDPEWGPVFHRSGRIQFHLFGELKTVPTPTLGQLKKLKAAHHDANDLVNSLSNKLVEETGAAADRLDEARTKLIEIEKRVEENPTAKIRKDLTAARNLVNQIDTDYKVEATRVKREAEQAAMQAATDWFVNMFDMFNLAKVDDPDDLPAWCGQLGLVRQFVEHWMTFPSPRGV